MPNSIFILSSPFLVWAGGGGGEGDRWDRDLRGREKIAKNGVGGRKRKETRGELGKENRRGGLGLGD